MRCCVSATSTRSPTASTVSWRWSRRAAAWTARSRPAWPAARWRSTSPASSSSSRRASSSRRRGSSSRRTPCRRSAAGSARRTISARRLCTAGQEGRTGGHRQPGAFRRRLRARDRRGLDPAQSPVDGQAHRGGRQRPGRTHAGRRHGHQRALGDHLRVAAQAGRCAGLRHPRVPAAEGHRRVGDRLPAPAGRQDRAQLHRRPAVHDRRAVRDPATTRSSWAPGPGCPCS